MEGPGRRTQQARRQLSRDALLEAGARNLSRYGYSRLTLERVAREAGYTRGALYHQFSGKEELALAVLDWVERAWYTEVWSELPEDADHIELLKATARRHAVFCRRDIAGVMMALRVEFSTRDHPIGAAVSDVVDRVTTDCRELIQAARDVGAIGPGPPASVLAAAVVSAVEGVTMGLGGDPAFDELMAEAVVAGLLDIASDAADPAPPE